MNVDNYLHDRVAENLDRIELEVAGHRDDVERELNEINSKIQRITQVLPYFEREMEWLSQHLAKLEESVPSLRFIDTPSTVSGNGAMSINIRSSNIDTPATMTELSGPHLPQKKIRGRDPLRFIENAKNRQRSLETRKRSLHKKANDLAIVTGFDIFVMMVSDNEVESSFATPGLKTHSLLLFANLYRLFSDQIGLRELFEYLSSLFEIDNDTYCSTQEFPLTSLGKSHINMGHWATASRGVYEALVIML
ncbi:hypothetical protein K435DRAFT_814065 [Dendrothele bispora CBS 962.96]|uniref:MADS-box domain-containing protein n=1 Tax=Dendrothele bispora (strain CBS 962.96) TaxID=1314807 RepID=A0A4S8KJV5_DENBC|nr:hypothetical protein K435DRAFT_814065 [Dendrothele bispora CBS 962.96]